MRRAMLVFITCCVLLGVSATMKAGAAGEAGIPTVDWWWVGGGSGRLAQGAFSVEGGAGQWVTGEVQNGAVELSPGFAAEAENRYRLFLPIVVK